MKPHEIAPAGSHFNNDGILAANIFSVQFIV